MSYPATLRDDLGPRALARTGALCAAIAALLTAIDVSPDFVTNLVVSCSIGFSIHITTTLLVTAIGEVPSRGWRFALIAFALSLGLCIGLLLGGTFALGEPLYFFQEDLGSLWLGLFFGVLGTMIFLSMRAVSDMRERLARTELEATLREKQMAETQLKLLQAQIEPHFLFNTLSNVVSLIGTDPEAARRTLENLTTLLRSSLKRTRAETSTLGDEIDLLKSYLEIQRIRMGERLRYRISAEPRLRHEPLPPLLIQPLVENAVVHGLEPAEAGGELTITATATARELIIAVGDTGVGAGSSEVRNGTGTGLANVRARLRALFGDDASITLSENSGGGLSAVMRVPRKSSA